MTDTMYHVDAYGERISAPTGDSRTYSFVPYNNERQMMQLVEIQRDNRIRKGAILADSGGWTLSIYDVGMDVVIGTHKFASFEEAACDMFRLAAQGILDIAE